MTHLLAAAFVCALVSVAATNSGADDLPLPLLPLHFTNAPQPFLAPDPTSSFDSTVTMNPNIVRVGNDSHATWRLFYAGADNRSIHRIALATAPAIGETPLGAQWTRQGVVLDHGDEPTDFNSDWSVLPLVVNMSGRWHMCVLPNP